MIYLIYLAAAAAEIAGCFAFWAWLRLDRSPLVDAEHAGRAYAAYGGIYILSALGWLWIAEGVRPDRWDVIGAGICLLGASVILWGPRPT